MDPRKREQYECRKNTYRRYLALLDRNLSSVELAGHTPMDCAQLWQAMSTGDLNGQSKANSVHNIRKDV